MELMLVELETEARFEPLETKTWGGGPGVVLRVYLNRALGGSEGGGKSGDGERRTGGRERGKGKREREIRKKGPRSSRSQVHSPKSICLPGEACHYN